VLGIGGAYLDCAGELSGLARKEPVGYQATKLLPNMMVYTDAKDPGSLVSHH